MTFVSGIGMIAICSVIVDFVATKIINQKDIYYKFKYLETPEWKDMRDGYHDVDNASQDESERTTVVTKKGSEF